MLPGELKAQLILAFARMKPEDLEFWSWAHNSTGEANLLPAWNPDLQEHGDGPSNGGRAAEAASELREGWGDTDYEDFTDLIADLLHLAYSRGEDPTEIAASAITHFVAETEEAG